MAPSSFRRRWPLISRILELALGFLAVYFIFAPDIFPILTADSNHYVEQAQNGIYTENPTKISTPNHYKTAGYPLFLQGAFAVADSLGQDATTFVAVVQRSMLAQAAHALFFVLGLSSILLVFILTTPIFITQTNFVLTEGMTIPVSVLSALSLYGLQQEKKRANTPKKMQTFRTHPNRNKRPELAKFYDRGPPYPFLHSVEKQCGGLDNFVYTSIPHRKRAEQLIEAAGLSLSGERLTSFKNGFFGGGKYELNKQRSRVLAVSGHDKKIHKWQNQISRRFGAIFPKKKNARVVHGFGTSEQTVKWTGDPQFILSIILSLSFMVVAATRRTQIDTLYLASFLVYCIQIAAFASILCDLWRYIAPAWCVFATLQLAGIVDSAKQEIAKRKKH